MHTKVIKRTAVHSCKDMAELEGLSPVELHQKLIDDEAFLYEMTKKAIGVTDAEWNKMPIELMEALALPMKHHAAEFVWSAKHPMLSRLLDIANDFNHILAPIAQVVGFITIGAIAGTGIGWYISLMFNLFNK